MGKKQYALIVGLAIATTTANAWLGGAPWGGTPWGGSGYDKAYNNGYGSGMGYMGGDQYRGGTGSGSGDFSMNLSGRGSTNMRGYGSGYDAGDGWGRGYSYSAPYYGGYNIAPFGARMMPMQPVPEGK